VLAVQRVKAGQTVLYLIPLVSKLLDSNGGQVSGFYMWHNAGVVVGYYMRAVTAVLLRFL
jgi:hypothetical protein